MTTPVGPSLPITMPAAPDIRELLARAERTLERIRRKIQEGTRKLNQTLDSIPGRLIPEIVVAAIRAGMQKAYELFDKLLRKMSEYLAAPGWPPLLFETGDHWLSDIANPALATEEDINASQMEVDNHWQGPAAENYTSTLGTQQAACADMVGLARAVKGLLDIAAWGIIKFWVGLGIALVGAAAGVVGFIGLCGSVAGAPFAPADLVATLLGVLATIASGAWAVGMELKNITQAASDLRENRKYNPAFAGESGDSWPRAIAGGAWKAD